MIRRATRPIGSRLAPQLARALGVSALLLPAALGACTDPVGTCPAGAFAPIPVGTVPNDVAFAECEGEPVLLVPASGDARLDVFTLPCGALRGSVLFPPEGAAPANPWAVAVLGERALVTLQGQGTVALVDVCDARLLDRARPAQLLDLDPPLSLTTPLDADGDGAAESSVSRLLPRAPQAVLASGALAFVGYTNLLEPGLSAAQPPVLGPGLLARFAVEGDDLHAEPALATLPCANPQGLSHGGDGTLWISCSGPLGPSAEAAVAALGDGALLRVDAASLEILEVVDAARFAPGTPALLPDGLVVGSLLQPALATLSGNALDARAVHGKELESLFECTAADTTAGPRALCTHFSGDRLLVARVDAEGPSVEAEIPVGPGGPVARGAQALALAPDSARARGIGAAVLLGLSAEVILLPVEALP